jgi:SPP1 family predicted phage head-tail adaptor
MKPVEAGKLRRQVTIQAEKRTADGYGGYTKTWEDVCTVWASIEPLSGSELFAAMQSESEIRYKIKIRYRNDIQPFMRVATHDGRVFEIVAVIDVEYAHRMIELECKELTP